VLHESYRVDVIGIAYVAQVFAAACEVLDRNYCFDLREHHLVFETAISLLMRGAHDACMQDANQCFSKQWLNI
jgi:hypothetical protein